MNTTILWRLAWKEHRLLRDFWLAVLALCGVCLLIMAWRMKTTDDPANLFFVAMGITACYALGCGTMAFAGEREARTDDLQRALPVSPRDLLLGKIFHALASTLTLGIVLWLFALLAAQQRWGEVQSNASLATAGALPALLGGLTALQLLAWGIFFSLRSSRPLRVVILAFLANALVSYPISWLLSDIPLGYRTVLYFPSFFGDLPTVVPRLIVVAVVLGLDFRLVQRWFRDSSGGSAEASGPTISALVQSTDWWSRWNAYPQWQRLTWQEWRSSRLSFWPIALTYVVLTTLILTTSPRTDWVPSMLEAPLVVVGGLLGTCVFHNDQRRRQFRFLAEHGVSPSRLWWTRQSFWCAFLPVLCFVAVVVDYVWWRISGVGPRWQVEFPGAFLGLTLISYCGGQLLSLWIRSAVVRVTMTVLVTIPLALWAAMMAALGIPLVWSVAPIPLVLLVASRAGVRDWMLERTGRAVRVKMTLTLVIPALAILAAVIAFRWTEIPGTEPTFTTPPRTTAQRDAARTKGEEYLHAMASFDPSPAGLPHDREWEDRDLMNGIDPAEFEVNWLSQEQIQWLDEHRELIERTLEVTPGAFLLPADMEHLARYVAFGPVSELPPSDKVRSARVVLDRKASELPGVLIKSAQRCQKDGDLDGALDRYLAALDVMSGWRHDEGPRIRPCVRGFLRTTLRLLRYWAGKPGQTAERIRRAMQGMERADEMMAGLEPELERFYSVGKQCLAGDEAIFREESAWWGWAGGDPAFYKWFYRLLPWERQRALRLHNTSAARELAAVERIRRAMERNEPVQLRPSADKDVERWYNTTITIGLAREFGRQYWLSRQRDLVDMTAVQRATLIVLALQGWRLEHGALPETLSELAPTWFAQVPVDPMTGMPFQYYPNGLSEPTTWLDEMTGIYVRFALPPQRPFVEAECARLHADGSSGYTTTEPNYARTRRIFPIPVSK